MIGEGGIRTPGTASGSTVFKTASFDHSDTSPKRMEAGSMRKSALPPSRSTGSATILTLRRFVNKTGECRRNAEPSEDDFQQTFEVVGGIVGDLDSPLAAVASQLDFGPELLHELLLYLLHLGFLALCAGLAGLP